MTLYSADVLDIAKPVATKGKGKKAAASASEPVKEEVEVKQEEPAGKMKKEPTEKQLAALKRAQEARQRKKEEVAAAAAEKERLEQERLDQERQKEEAAAAKKEAAKLKRKLARESKKEVQQLTTPATTESIGSVEEEIEAGIRAPVAKKARVEGTDGPPSWFTQYVAGVKKEEAKLSKEKKPQRQIKQEAMDAAEHQWNDGFTRDRVRNEVDNHMSRMYQMMFSGRRLK
jgi:hypothetical protein